MSFAKNASRFDFLPDDAGDPFETASKKNRKKTGSGGGSGDKKKSAGKSNSNSDRKQLQSLAFGSSSEGKKKSKAPCQAQPSSGQQNGISNTESAPSSSTKEVNPNGNIPTDVKMERNGNSSEKNAKHRPKGMSSEQWEEWQKRDADIMDETYAAELQSALLQSKLEYETEQKSKPLVGKGKKKKPVAVPLTEFNARLNETGTANSGNALNGNFILPLGLGGQNYQPAQPSEADEELVERFRMEARLELERERQKALERQLLMSRQPPPPLARPTPISATSPSTTIPLVPVDEKDLIISRLTEENLRLKAEIDLLKDRVKTINNYLQAAQEVKDKAKLVYELDTMTKANSDLNEELRQVHSQLEQERSRSGAALGELRRLLENRRRTTTESSNT